MQSTQHDFESKKKLSLKISNMIFNMMIYDVATLFTYVDSATNFRFDKVL